MKLIGTIQNVPISLSDDESMITYTAIAAVDCDGSPNWKRDPCGQPDTSLHYQGKALNADVVPFCVVPPLIIQAVRGIVMGSLVIMTNLTNGRRVVGVVGDLGPHNKLGELSDAAAEALGMNPSPIDGGTDEHIIQYAIYPGVAATVNGITYDLQAAA